MLMEHEPEILETAYRRLLRILFLRDTSESGGIQLQHIGDTDAIVGLPHSYEGGCTFFLTVYPSIFRCQHIYTPSWRSRIFPFCC